MLDPLCITHLRLVTHFKFFIVGPDQKMVTKRTYNWSPGLILGALVRDLGFPAELGPETRSNGWGSKNGAERNQN